MWIDNLSTSSNSRHFAMLLLTTLSINAQAQTELSKSAAHLEPIPGNRTPVLTPAQPRIDPRQTPIPATTDPEQRRHLEPVAPHLRPGRHDIVLSVKEQTERKATRTDGGCTYAPIKYAAGAIGWAQVEVWHGACGAEIHQRAILFDTQPIDAIPSKRIDRAILSYEEAPLSCPTARYPNGCWTDGEFRRAHKPEGCVIVRVPEGDWRQQPGTTFIRSSALGGNITRLDTTQWDVTTPFNHEHGYGHDLGGMKHWGFLLTGWPESLDALTADDNTTCISRITNVTLHVTYTVPPPDGPLPPLN